MCSASDTRWEGCEWNVSRTRANVGWGKAAAAAAGGAVTCSWQLLAQSQTSFFFFISLPPPPPLPHPLARRTHTQRRRQFNSSISSRLFPFSISFFLAARRKPIYSSWKWWDQTRWEWIGHPSPQEPRCQSLRNPSTTTTLRLSYITAAPYHLPK